MNDTSEEIKKEMKFICQRVYEQTEYIEKVKNSDLSQERKNEIIKSANGVLYNFQKRMGEMINTGLINGFEALQIGIDLKNEELDFKSKKYEGTKI